MIMIGQYAEGFHLFCDPQYTCARVLLNVISSPHWEREYIRSRHRGSNLGLSFVQVITKVDHLSESEVSADFAILFSDLSIVTWCNFLPPLPVLALVKVYDLATELDSSQR